MTPQQRQAVIEAIELQRDSRLPLRYDDILNILRAPAEPTHGEVLRKAREVLAPPESTDEGEIVDYWYNLLGKRKAVVTLIDAALAADQPHPPMAGQGEPVASFIATKRADGRMVYAQVADEYAGDADVVKLYTAPPSPKFRVAFKTTAPQPPQALREAAQAISDYADWDPVAQAYVVSRNGMRVLRTALAAMDPAPEHLHFTDCSEALLLLGDKINNHAGFLTPKPCKTLTKADYSAIDYLCSEWDYAWEETPSCPATKPDIPSQPPIDNAHVAPGCEPFDHQDRAALLLNRASRPIDEWSRIYGQHQPQWLPPGGEVRLQEDIDDYLKAPEQKT